MNISCFKLDKYSLISDGAYKAVLTESRKEISKNGRPMLRLTWKLTDAPYEGRTIDSFIMLDIESALEVFAILIYYLGFNLEQIKDTNQLHGSGCRLIIKTVKSDFGAINSIVNYLPLLKKD